MSIKRTTSDRYDINVGKSGWATIIVGTDGQILVQSDWGNWAHWWNCHGCKTIKHFLTGIDTQYLIGKFGGRKSHFNYEKTIAGMKKEIIHLRRDGTIQNIYDKYEKVPYSSLYCKSIKEFVRTAWDSIDSLNTCSVDSFMSDLMNTTPLSMIFEHPDSISIVMEPDPGLINFTEKVWPVFINELRDEIGYNVK